MTEPVDYFSNHRYKTRFPWRLYHGPIIESLRGVVTNSAGSTMLNLGSGPFFENAELGPVAKVMTLCDIDPRAMELARQIHGAAIHGFDVIEPGKPLPYPTGSFDLVVSMDVIEHVPDPEPWLDEAFRVLSPGGTLFLTTPNYASLSLRTIEATVLELIARRQGFSRRLLHPSKMTPLRLERLLAARSRGQFQVDAIAFGWVLAATARKG